MTSQARVHELVLFYLGAATTVGCQENPRPRAASGGALEPTARATPTVDTTPAPTLMTDKSSRPIASAPPTATVAASAVPYAVAYAVPYAEGSIGDPCTSESHCAKGLFCERSFDGARFLPEPGRCVSEHPLYEGRPLTIDGVHCTAESHHTPGWLPARVAAGGAAHLESNDDATPPQPTAEELDVALIDEHQRASLAEGMRAAALEEHASVGAFARTICELLALGAPAWLVQQSNAALSDEIRHAAESFAWATALGSINVGPGPLPAAVAPLRSGPDAAAELLRDVFRGGCVGETLAAYRAIERSAASTTPGLRSFYAALGEDETRHAALAFETVRWLVAEHPSLAVIVAEEKQAFLAAASATDRATVEPLLALVDSSKLA